MQIDPRSLGRGGSVGRRDDGRGGRAAAPTAGLGATPGSEHLSGLREAYLRLLAGENGLGYHRLRDAAGLAAALRDPALARPVPVRGDLRLPLAALAFALLLAPHALAWGRRWRGSAARRRGTPL